MANRTRRRRRSQTIGVTVVVLVFMAVMSLQIYRVKQKNDEYAARENELKKEYEAETQRETELNDLEKYMNSSEYIEDVAESKL